MAKIKVLLLEDSGTDGALIARKLRDCADVTRFDSRATFEAAMASPWDVALLDLNLGDISGREAIAIIKEAQPELPVIIVTGSASPQEADAACSLGACRYFLKDELNGLDRAVKQAKEVRDLRTQSTKNQRLELLGDLSAGVVHDFNGILQIFTMGVAALRPKINPDDEHTLDLMEGASKRGGEMTGQILAFARGSNGTKFKSVTAEYLVSEVGAIMRRTFPPNIRTESITEPGTGSARCDATQMIQVLVNLATNSRDAMPNGGKIRLTAQTVARADDVQGPCIMFKVEDTGMGIPQESISSIWEPFWTSKPHGAGTGLGLATVKRIVEEHHGAITVQSEVNRGTTFQVFIPTALPWTSSVARKHDTDIHGSGRTIVLVDDDNTIRELTGLILENAGYRVISAANGLDALDRFRGPGRVDVLITDLSMPHFDGRQLIDALRSQGFGVPVILLSGYDSPEMPDQTSVEVLRKPISREDLLAALQRAISD